MPLLAHPHPPPQMPVGTHCLREGFFLRMDQMQGHHAMQCSHSCIKGTLKGGAKERGDQEGRRGGTGGGEEAGGKSLGGEGGGQRGGRRRGSARGKEGGEQASLGGHERQFMQVGHATILLALQAVLLQLAEMHPEHASNVIPPPTTIPPGSARWGPPP